VSDRLRVLHAHPGNQFGGIETMLTVLARQPGRAEHRFALCFYGRLEAELRETGADIALLGAARFSRPWTVLRARVRLRRALGQLRPHVMLCHSPWSLALFAPVARTRRIPLAFWMHAPVTRRGWLDRWAARVTPDVVVCNSVYTRDAASAPFGGAPREVVYPPVEPPPPPSPTDGTSRARLRQALGVPPDTAVIVQVSRLEPWKGHQTLLQALGAMLELPGWTCRVVGGPQRPEERAYKQTLERQAERLRVREKVRFLGERRDVPDLLAASDVFCQVNVAPEPFGMVFVEALYAGLPVITSGLGGAGEIVTAECGISVPAGDAAALHGALERLVKDPRSRRRLGAAGPKRAADLCHPQRQAERLVGVLARVESVGRER
jgi:glycosyltransferase involved in cell wall biosynthesis